RAPAARDVRDSLPGRLVHLPPRVPAERGRARRDPDPAAQGPAPRRRGHRGRAPPAGPRGPAGRGRGRLVKRGIAASAPTRIDLAGGTLDIWPLSVLVPGALTLNVAISLRSGVVVTPRSDRRVVVV